MEFTGFEGNDKMWRHKDLANLERLLRRREGLPFFFCLPSLLCTGNQSIQDILIRVPVSFPRVGTGCISVLPSLVFGAVTGGRCLRLFLGRWELGSG